MARVGKLLNVRKYFGALPMTDAHTIRYLAESAVAPFWCGSMWPMARRASSEDSSRTLTNIFRAKMTGSRKASLVLEDVANANG